MHQRCTSLALSWRKKKRNNPLCPYVNSFSLSFYGRYPLGGIRHNAMKREEVRQQSGGDDTKCWGPSRTQNIWKEKKNVFYKIETIAKHIHLTLCCPNKYCFVRQYSFQICWILIVDLQWKKKDQWMFSQTNERLKRMLCHTTTKGFLSAQFEMIKKHRVTQVCC